MVTPAELDRAVAAGVADLTRENARPIRCSVCGRLCGVGQARRLWIDGHKRGFACTSCQWTVAITQEQRHTQERKAGCTPS